ncbi:DUF2971 domain-containing protein [uncultured Methanobrevibacter sp.]|uniref:DUF2971 domain-containing protein n=1 Tax=uncultured Methanobrevibacter sp. TaxID=253161 RepID=UPI0025F70B14|nr:DUF2971 domain-containing protein [uncultured Methanobrevibacter sp.]
MNNNKHAKGLNMNKNLTITKSNKKFNDFKKHFNKEMLEKIDIIFITTKNSNNNHSTLKKEFYEFLEKQYVKLDFIEYHSEKTTKSNIFWDIGDFIVKDIVLSTTMSFLLNFIDESEMKIDDTISFIATVELKSEKNICINYTGTLNNFMNIIFETNYFNDILNKYVHWIGLFYDNYFKLESNANNNKKYLFYKNFNLPHSLYQYTKVEYAKGLLHDNLMYLRRFDELNDPFEGSFLDDVKKIKFNYNESLSHLNEEEKEYLESQILEKRRKDYLKIQNEYKKTYRVACFSQDNDSAPMWAFYGDEHEGICIEYDFHDEMKFREFCYPIKYVDETNNNSITKLLIENKDLTNRSVQELFLKKYKSWNYEKEWRIVIQDEKADHIFEPKWNDEKKFIDFLKPKAVYLRLKIEPKNRAYIKHLCRPTNIPVYQMIESTSGYRLIPKKTNLN